MPAQEPIIIRNEDSDDDLDDNEEMKDQVPAIIPKHSSANNPAGR